MMVTMRTDMSIEQTPTGWHIECRGFTADLPFCTCDGAKAAAYAPCPGHSHKDWRDCRPDESRCKLIEYRGGYHVAHVRTFLKRLAATYDRPQPEVPDVPFMAAKLDPTLVMVVR